VSSSRFPAIFDSAEDVPGHDESRVCGVDCISCREHPKIVYLDNTASIGFFLNPSGHMTDSASRPRKALVIGAGPVGALTALSLHRRGWEVAIWDMREGEAPAASSLSRSDFQPPHGLRFLIADTPQIHAERRRVLPIRGLST
jgi:hypothetical protein